MGGVLSHAEKMCTEATNIMSNYYSSEQKKLNVNGAFLFDAQTKGNFVFLLIVPQPMFRQDS